MTNETNPRLHWTQRVALIRHNLHAARRTNDFTFFKSLQAHALIDGTDHVNILYTAMGDSADSILSTLDNLNAGIAYVHQDAFKAVYDSVKAAMHTNAQSLDNRKSMLRVDICQQREMADHAIDKTANSAINFIQIQPEHCQDAVANAWITGTTIIADAVHVCLNEMAHLEAHLDDFIRLEYSWNCIQSSVDAAISALRGIFSLMAASNPAPVITQDNGASPQTIFRRNLSVSSASSDNGNASTRSRNSSTASAFSLIKRAFSNAHAHPPPSATQTTRLSPLVPEANTRNLRMSISAAYPTKMSSFGDHPHTILTTIPHTPATETADGMREENLLSPFKQTSDFFAFGEVDKDDKVDATGDLMHLEDLDPLYSPAAKGPIEAPAPLPLRRMSESFDLDPGVAIAV